MIAADFAALPPEVISGWLYTGPGSAPISAAAAAWDNAAAELGAAGASYQTLISELTNASWQGPSAMSMSTAVRPYIQWLSATAGRAEEAAAQARAAAAAYDEAFAMAVPPPVIAANRSTLVSLVATNILGQNTSAIAATQAHYGEMWAQDAATMYQYAARAAAATTLSPFTDPGPGIGRAPRDGQSAAGVGAVDGAASQVSNALQALSAGPIAANSPIAQLIIDVFTSPIVVELDSLFTNVSPVLSLTSGVTVWGSAGMFALVPLVTAWVTQAQSALGAAGAAAAAWTISDVSGGGLAATLMSATDTIGGWNGSNPSAAPTSLGRAGRVGGLSVPPTWEVTKGRLVSLAAALPAETAGTDGLYAGVPPIGGIVNAPQGSAHTVKGPRSNLTPQLTGSIGGQRDTSDRLTDSGSATSDMTERDELEALRRAVSEVSLQTDALREQASILLKKALKQ